MTISDLGQDVQSKLGRWILEGIHWAEKNRPQWTRQTLYAGMIEELGLDCHHPSMLLKHEGDEEWVTDTNWRWGTFGCICGAVVKIEPPGNLLTVVVEGEKNKNTTARINEICDAQSLIDIIKKLRPTE